MNNYRQILAKDPAFYEEVIGLIENGKNLPSAKRYGISSNDIQRAMIGPVSEMPRAEAMILMHLRPALLIRNNKIETPDSAEMQRRFMPYLGKLECRIPSVGRIEIHNIGRPFAGTGWMFAVVSGKLVERDRNKSRQIEQERYFAGIGQASTVIVHDLKNPLISIQGFARRIQEGKGDISQAAQTIIASANTMQRIVNDVLEFAKPLRMDFHNEDIRAIIRRACESCRTKAAENGITLAEVLPAEPVISATDSFQLARALVNLIDNSVDASSRGGHVTVTAVSAKNKLIITIKDHGIGMDSETLDNLFELTYTTKNEGTGFGVPISKKIIDAHHGMIRVKSQKGIGTEVIIELPIKKMTNPEPITEKCHDARRAQLQ